MSTFTIDNPVPSQRTRSAMVLIGLVGLAALILAAAPARSVAANGVHFDPESPAGKEYALPLDQARNEATGGDSEEIGSDEESAESAPLFGEGVAGSGDGGQAGGPQGVPDERSGPGRDDGGSGVNGGDSVELGPGELSDSGESYSLLSGVGLVALILLAGLGLGLGLRSMQRVRTE